MVTVEEAIAQIDSYINAIIEDMIKFRTKRLEASSKVLDKIKALMEAISYSYRIGELYNKAIKIETETLKQRDVSSPRIKLSYKGPKTTLLYNNYYVEVPEVPVFVWETRRPEQLAYEANFEVLRQNMALKFPVETNIAEDPFIENALGKYYLLDLSGYSYAYGSFEYAPIGRLSIHGIVFYPKAFEYQHMIEFRRTLTIDGNQYPFIVKLYFGTLLGDQYIDPSTTFEDVRVPATHIAFVANYTGECSLILFGNEYTSAAYKTGTPGAVKDILLIFTEGETIAYELD